MAERRRLLSQWVIEQAGRLGLGLTSAALEPVSGDASFRRYFRAYGETAGRRTSWIAVDAPPDKENSRPFVRIADHWHAAGVRVPTLIATDVEQGFMLLEDFGDRLLLPALNDADADRLYGRAFAALHRIQSVAADTLPPYDEALLQREMGLFNEWFVERLLGLELSAEELAMLDRARSDLVDSALSQNQVSVHRDYHARNLMLLDDDGLGIIDFQDAVRGPVTYDLVSLLRDAYIRWPDARVAQWVEQFRCELQARGMTDATAAQFLAQFDLMGVQRQLKVLGIFSRLYLRDGKAGYLPDMPRTFGYLYRACARYPAMAGLHAFLKHRILPAMAAHPLFDETVLMAELA
jgi:aminoglycoside/choline kinase family phosphotransferase